MTKKKDPVLEVSKAFIMLGTKILEDHYKIRRGTISGEVRRVLRSFE